MACEFPVAVKAKLMLTAVHCLLAYFYFHKPSFAAHYSHIRCVCLSAGRLVLQDLADRFSVSVSMLSRIFNTWILLMEKELETLNPFSHPVYNMHRNGLFIPVVQYSVN